MVKTSTKYVCQQCGAQTPSWFGRCPSCNAWNSLVETRIETSSEKVSGQKVELFRLSQVKTGFGERVTTGSFEFDRVLGGGIVAGSVILLSGDPGIGKSTLLLQVASKIQKQTIYISGEESLEQIKIRSRRLSLKLEKTDFLAETNVENILATLNGQNPGLVICDSIQTMWTQTLAGTPGSIGQVRQSAQLLLSWAKKASVPLFLVGHVNKEGAIAGPMVLSHLVDTILFLEGERFSSLRLLRSLKNRFGPTDEVGVFEMGEKGMEEVSNPSKLFLASRTAKVPGSTVLVTMEGTRPVLVELQALVSPTQLPIPRRVGQGVDYNRLQMISAVLGKKIGLPLANFDLYVNVVGGLKVNEPAADLGIALAIISSFKNLALPAKMACFGELGLLGELRPVREAVKRTKEARRLGFTQVASPESFSSINLAAKKLLI